MIWSLIPDGLIAAVGAGLVGLVSLLVGKWLGKREGASVVRTERAEEYTDTRKRMDEADIVGDDPDAARRWLSERAKR